MRVAVEAETRIGRRPRWFPRLRFGTRSLLILVTLCAVLAATLGAAMREGIRHRRLADQIRSADGWADWSHHEWIDIGNRSRRLQSTLPAWVDYLQLDTAVRRIQDVHLRGNQSSDFNAQLTALAEVGKLRRVSIDGAGFGLPEFQRLMATVEMEELSASSPRDVSALHLPRGRIAAFKQGSLRRLFLSRTQFSDEAIDDLPDSIEYLNLTRTRVTDAGLMKFARLKHLAELNLMRTPTSLAAIEKLRTAMPGCKITWGPLDFHWHRHSSYQRWYRRDAKGALWYHDLWGSDFETIDYQGAVGQVDRATVFHNEAGQAVQERQRIAAMFDDNGWMQLDLAQQPTLSVTCVVADSPTPSDLEQHQQFVAWLQNVLGSTGLGDCQQDSSPGSMDVRCRVVDVPIARQVIGQELAKSAFAGYARILDE